MKERFVTKVDWWVAAVVLVSMAAGTIAAIATRDVVAITIIAGTWALLAAICIPCDYTLFDRELVVRSGLIRWRIPYSEITGVRSTRNPLSSPAWSLDRIEIGYGAKTILVSPRDHSGFLLALARRIDQDRRAW